MSERSFETAKKQLLGHVQNLFEELEQEMAFSHQEKYILLEDICENASDIDELKVAFERWYIEHEQDIRFEYSIQELWDHAMNDDTLFDTFEEKEEFDDD